MPNFARQYSDNTSFLQPSRDYFAITPNDGADLPFLTRAIVAGVAGSLVVVREDGTSVTFPMVAAGQQLNIVAARVKATGTTATGLVALT